MKKNLRLLCKIIMTSFICNFAISNENIHAAKATRTSRPVVINNSSQETTNNTDETNNNSSSNSNSSDSNSSSSNNSSTNSSSNESSDSSDNYTIIELLNSNKNLTIDDIEKLALSSSHSLDFIDEFKQTFPEFNPLRQITPIDNNLNNYLDVNNKEISTIKVTNTSPIPISIYADQNNCNMILGEISTLLGDLKNEIEEELPSTIFSLMPTMSVFNDTFKILSEEYSNILQSDYKNHITLNILLENLETKLSSLLKSIQEFQTQLPDLIDTLNKIAEDIENSKDNNTNTDEEIPSEDTSEETDNTNSETNGDETNGDETTKPDEEIIQDNNQSSSSSDKNTSNNNTNSNNNANTDSGNSSEEITDDTNEQEMIYLGEDGQQLIYDSENNKYYQANPENPESEEFIEYTGEVTEMTLEDYLNIEMYFDAEGNELFYDEENDEFLLYNEETDEFLIYEGEVTTMTLGDYLNLLENQE